MSFITVNDVTFHYKTWGTGTPPAVFIAGYTCTIDLWRSIAKSALLVFLHGGPGFADHNLYVPFWSIFQNIAQMIFIDMHGHGNSDGWHQKDKLNLKTWGKDVKDFCNQLAIEKTYYNGILIWRVGGASIHLRTSP
jgi:pimeloyl-ACP methyl ester carboxylesterase